MMVMVQLALIVMPMSMATIMRRVVLLLMLMSVEFWKWKTPSKSIRLARKTRSAAVGAYGASTRGEGEEEQEGEQVKRLPQGFAALRNSYTIVYTLMMGESMNTVMLSTRARFLKESRTHEKCIPGDQYPSSADNTFALRLIVRSQQRATGCKGRTYMHSINTTDSAKVRLESCSLLDLPPRWYSGPSLVASRTNSAGSLPASCTLSRTLSAAS